ncbi:hypothetical protein EDB19DRAFT_1911607 [Suillus lakei]|nr:hypothetical protein EDB19DRAFT_1911607 [Suillus lakei]
MAQELSHTDRVHWTETENDQLVLYLFNNQAQVCNTRNFKDATYNGAAEAIAPYLQIGPKKTGTMCKTKWGALKQTYNAIQKYCQQSGVHWDNVTGANIQGQGATTVWDEYISKKGNNAMRSFRVSGWRHYEKVDNIIPQGSGARGSTGYHPHTAPPPPLSSNSSASMPAAGNNTMGATITTSSVSAASAGPPAVAAPTSTPSRISQGPTSVSGINTLSTSLVSRPSSKHSHSDMVDELTTSFPAPSVSIQSEEPITTQTLPPPSKSGSLKRAKTTSGHAQTQSGVAKDSKSDIKMSKATTAVAVMGFQSSVDRLTDVISECMVYPEDRVMDQCSRAMQMLQVDDADLPFAERLMMQQVFAMDPAATDIYMQTTDKDMRHAFILSTAQRLGIQPMILPPRPNS